MKHSKAIPTDLTRIVVCNKKKSAGRDRQGGEGWGVTRLRGGCKTAAALQVSALARAKKMLIQRGQANDHAHITTRPPTMPLSTHPSPEQAGLCALARLLYLIPQCLDATGRERERESEFVFWLCHNKIAGQRRCTGGRGGATTKYAKERNTIFVKRTTDNLPLNRAWHFKQAKPTTTTSSSDLSTGRGWTTRQKEIIKINKRASETKKKKHDSKAKGMLTERKTKKIKKMKRK